MWPISDAPATPNDPGAPILAPSWSSLSGGDHSEAPGGEEPWRDPIVRELPSELRARVEAELDLPRALIATCGYLLEAAPSPEQPWWNVRREGQVTDGEDGGVRSAPVRLRLWRQPVEAATAPGWTWVWEAGPDEWQLGGGAVELLAAEWGVAERMEVDAPDALTRWLEHLLATHQLGVGHGRRPR